MLTDLTPFSSFSVKDIREARNFYTDVLGLQTSDPGMACCNCTSETRA